MRDLVYAQTHYSNFSLKRTPLLTLPSLFISWLKSLSNQELELLKKELPLERLELHEAVRCLLCLVNFFTFNKETSTYLSSTEEEGVLFGLVCL